MLSDEEKAIEELKNKKADYFMISNLTGKTLVNLIEKQQKEIEELKEKNKNLNWYFENQKDNFVHKDKIKAKIEEYKKDGKIINQTMPYCGEYINHFEIKALQSLLEKE